MAINRFPLSISSWSEDGSFRAARSHVEIVSENACYEQLSFGTAWTTQGTFAYTLISGFFGEWLCLSHNETCLGANGEQIEVREGMTVTAFDEDVDDEGNPDNLIATGAST